MSRRFLKRLEKESEKQESSPSESESGDSIKPSFNFNLLNEEFSQGGSETEELCPVEVKTFTKQKKKTKKFKESHIDKPICQTKKPTMADLINSIIKIDSKKLNLENEVQEIFKSASSASRPGREKHKRDIFGKPKPEWIRNYRNPGVHMERRGGNNFVFVYNEVFQMAEKKFIDGVHLGNMLMIAEARKICPFHISSMLFISQLMLSENFEQSFDFLQFVLYIYKNVFDVHFNITSPVNCSGDIRFLDFKAHENRTFYYSLNTYMLVAINKLCYRTALEMAKLIFSLDPFEDPLGILLIIDNLSLRAKEYKFLIDFYESFREIKNLHLLPNFAYSVSIAKYYAEGEESGKSAMCFAIRTFPVVVSWLPWTFVDCPPEMKVGSPLNVALHIIYSSINESLFSDPSSPGSVVMNAAIRRMREGENFDFDLIVTNYSDECDHVNNYFPRPVARRIFLSQISRVDFHMTHALDPGERLYDHDPFPPRDSVMASPPLVDFDSTFPLINSNSSDIIQHIVSYIRDHNVIQEDEDID